MQTVLLKYVDGMGSVQKMQLPFLSVRGFDEPDEIQLVPPRIARLFNGFLRTQFKGFRRVVTVNFGVLGSSERAFLFRFFSSNTRSIYLGVTAGQEEEIIFATDQTEYESEWRQNCVLGRSFTLKFAENAIRNAWTDYTPASGIDIMYIKKKVKIIGTQESPEEFTTNSGKLVTMETGLSYPSISLLSWVVSVDTVPYQDAKINQVGDVVNTGTNLTFSLAVSGAGSPSPDGYYYADIIIGLQPRP